VMDPRNSACSRPKSAPSEPEVTAGDDWTEVEGAAVPLCSVTNTGDHRGQHDQTAETRACTARTHRGAGAMYRHHRPPIGSTSVMTLASKNTLEQQHIPVEPRR